MYELLYNKKLMFNCFLRWSLKRSHRVKTGYIYIYKCNKNSRLGFYFSSIGNEHNRINKWIYRLILFGVDGYIFLIF